MYVYILSDIHLECQDEIDYKRMDEILEYLYKNRPQFLDIHQIQARCLITLNM